MPVSSTCYGALALEVAALPQRVLLDRDAAETLAQHVADDLLRVLPGVPTLDLTFVGAHYDPIELLRPGWPLHAVLAELGRRAPASGSARVIALGSASGALPASLPPPDAGLTGGPLRVLPFILSGAPDLVAPVAQAMEAKLLETGMAGAATALFAQEAFAVRIEHARYLSLHDLCALTSMQYEHAGLAALWPLIETALFAPDEEAWLDAPPEPVLRYVGREVRLAVTADAPRAVAARARQFGAVLSAHAIPVRSVDTPNGTDARDALQRNP